nr:unnamed protein product [Callosobruchus chinensis]
MQFENVARMNNWSNEADMNAQTLCSSYFRISLQAKEGFTTFAYEVQSLAKRAFVSSPIDMQQYAKFNEAKPELGERLAQVNVENKKLKSDPSNVLDDAKQSIADLSRPSDVEIKTEQRLAHFKNLNGRLKKALRCNNWRTKTIR